MSSVGDAFAALRNVILLRERVEGVRQDVDGLSRELKALKDDVIGIDKRVIRIETMIEMSGRGSAPLPRIEG